MTNTRGLQLYYNRCSHPVGGGDRWCAVLGQLQRRVHDTFGTTPDTFDRVEVTETCVSWQIRQRQPHRALRS
jgi:hypothetical protein